MPKRKRQPGRPHGRSPFPSRKRQFRPLGDKYPPRPDLERMDFGEAMRKALNSGPVGSSRELERTEWRCIDCGRQVWYPEVFYNDNRCEQCHQKAQGQ